MNSAIRTCAAWLNIKAYPEAIFQLESVKVLTGDYKTASPAQPAKFAVFGTLTLNGVKQPLSGTAQGWRENDRVIVAGETTVDTMKHGLPQIREMVLTVGRNVNTAFRFSFVLPSDHDRVSLRPDISILNLVIKTWTPKVLELSEEELVGLLRP